MPPRKPNGFGWPAKQSLRRERTGQRRRRSIPAATRPRSVPQRLLIISAGVVMNLIFAVIFGMVAYRMGVSYTPCLVGSTSPGLSAWEVGLQTGDRILQLGRDGVLSNHLRFDKDMMVKVMMTGANHDLDLLVQPYAAARHVRLAAAMDDRATQQPASGTARSTDHRHQPVWLARGRPHRRIAARPGSPDRHAGPAALQAGDVITAVNGEPVEDYVQLSVQLARRGRRPDPADRCSDLSKTPRNGHRPQYPGRAQSSPSQCAGWAWICRSAPLRPSNRALRPNRRDCCRVTGSPVSGISRCRTR